MIYTTFTLNGKYEKPPILRQKNRFRCAFAPKPIKKGRISISLFFGTNLIIPFLWKLIHKNQQLTILFYASNKLLNYCHSDSEQLLQQAQNALRHRIGLRQHRLRCLQKNVIFRKSRNLIRHVCVTDPALCGLQLAF